MAQDKKGSVDGKSQSAEQLTDEKLDEVSGGKKIHIIVNESKPDEKAGVCVPYGYRR